MFEKCPYCNHPIQRDPLYPAHVCTHCCKHLSNPNAILLHFMKKSIWIKLTFWLIALAFIVQAFIWVSRSVILQVILGIAASIAIGWWLLKRNGRD